jgi:hypothetical protein
MMMEKKQNRCTSLIASTLAPASRRIETIDSWPLLHAHINGVQPVLKCEQKEHQRLYLIGGIDSSLHGQQSLDKFTVTLNTSPHQCIVSNMILFVDFGSTIKKQVWNSFTAILTSPDEWSIPFLLTW